MLFSYCARITITMAFVSRELQTIYYGQNLPSFFFLFMLMSSVSFLPLFSAEMVGGKTDGAGAERGEGSEVEGIAVEEEVFVVGGQTERPGGSTDEQGAAVVGL